jgi:protein-L-isoaspartate(D-aspartate) O-methyltransferase
MDRADTADVRRRFVAKVELRSAALAGAFVRVPREDFVGPGPWKILRPTQLDRGYETTPDNDPRHLYDFVLVALDAERGVNNGEPGSLLRWLDALSLAPGDRFLHVGCGVGYYTAIAAEAVGPNGAVIGVEIDPLLAIRAAQNLRRWPNVAVTASGEDPPSDPSFDAVFVNAGATEILVRWLDCLRPGGRLLVPLTVARSATETVGFGSMWLVTRHDDGHAARFVSPVGIFHCAGARTDVGNARLKEAYARGGDDRVRSLRRDAHERGPWCWLHGEGFCLSTPAVLN